MVVRFNLERGDQAVANVHDTGVFAGALHDELAARRQALEVHFAGFVGAVLAPHHREDAEFGDVRFAAEDLFDAGVFVRRQAVLRCDFGSDANFRGCRGHLQAYAHRGAASLRLRSG